MTDERPDSLAAQAASWVPPWERAQRPPDPAYAAAQRAQTDADDDADVNAGAGQDDDADVESGEAGSDDRGSEVPPELPPVPGEAEGPATVDAPQELAGEEELAPTDVGVGPEVPVPGAIEEALENEIGSSPLVDAPLPADGDDAGDVFDHAADDELADDAEVDLPIAEEVPGPDEDDTEEVPGPADEDTAARNESAEPAAGGGRDEPAEPVGGAGRGEAAGLDAGHDPSQGDVPVAGLGGAAESSGGAVGVPGIPGQGRRGRSGGAASGDAATRTDEKKAADEKKTADDDELKPLDDGELRAALEAILLVVDEPVAEMQLAQIVEQPTERVAAMLEDISARYTAAGHGFDLRRVAGGWRLYTRPEYAPYVERFVLDGQSVRLTQAALETLAVVAYKQPVTRSRISAIRGVNCDGVMRTLVTRGLIEECGTEGETGAFLYRTTALFLEKLGLNSVDQLPPLAPFLPDDVEEVLDASG